jgi:RAB protein geranylgeranyltransferase component A
MKLATKLKHVDIHHHWLRQEVQDQRLQIDWVPTTEMPADGLTKALSTQKHQAFIQQIGLVDIRHLIEPDSE